MAHKKSCTTEGCEKPTISIGLCMTCYSRKQRRDAGDPIRIVDDCAESAVTRYLERGNPLSKSEIQIKTAGQFNKRLTNQAITVLLREHRIKNVHGRYSISSQSAYLMGRRLWDSAIFA